MKMDSRSWMKALEKFDRDVDINAMTTKEVGSLFSNESVRSIEYLDRSFARSSF